MNSKFIKIKNALSNDVFLNEDKIIKIYLNDEFKLFFLNQEKQILDKLNYKNKLINNGIEIEYFPHEKFSDSKITKSVLKKIIVEINKIHNLDTSGIKLTPFNEVYNNYLNSNEKIFESEIKVTEFEKKCAEISLNILPKGKQVVLHNDLVEGNFLKINNEQIKIIDFEYSGLGNSIFDLASFLTERDLTKNQVNYFIKKFCEIEEIDLTNLKYVTGFLQIFWTRWAIDKFNLTKKEIYKEIANWKYERFNRISKGEIFI